MPVMHTEELSWDPQNLCKSLSEAVCVCEPGTTTARWEVETGGPLESHCRLVFTAVHDLVSRTKTPGVVL